MAKQIQSMADALSIFMEQHPDIPECNPGTEIQQNTDNGNAQIRLDIIFERKGRAGKQATIVCGFPESYPLEKLQEIASTWWRNIVPRRSAQKTVRQPDSARIQGTNNIAHANNTQGICRVGQDIHPYLYIHKAVAW